MARASFTAPLFVPASRPDRFEKASLSGADAIIVDLEDAVAPVDKDAARACLARIGPFGVPAFIRINGRTTPWFRADLAAVAGSGAAHICVPKVENPADIDEIMSSIGREVMIMAQIETAAGLLRSAEIIAHPAVAQLAFGPADFFLDMQARSSSALTGHALATMAVASRAEGKPLPLDGPAFSVRDRDRIVEECRLARSCGAGGKLCIHPDQVEAVITAFAPSGDELAWARRVVEAGGDGGAAIVDGQMIDAPILARARALLSAATDRISDASSARHAIRK